MSNEQDTIMDGAEFQEQVLEEAGKFVRRNIVLARDGRQCVDGRYLNHGPQTGFLARPGGDFGYVMGLLGKTSLTPTECVDLVFNVVTQRGGKFYVHTDEHAVHSDDTQQTGCGHAAKALDPEFSSLYNVDPGDVEQALMHLRTRTTQPRNAQEVVLNGDHQEKGVLIVLGERRTLNHQDSDSMYFVYDRDRDDEMISRIAEQAHVSARDYKAALYAQTNATIKLLAAGKPIIEVDLRDSQPQLKFMGRAPHA